MITTTYAPARTPTVLHRVTGVIDRRQAVAGAAAALRLVQQQACQHGPLNLLLDLRGMQFQDLPAHRAWSTGFARHPALAGHLRAVALVGADTPAFRAEQALLTTAQVRFFHAAPQAAQWLDEMGGAAAAVAA